MIKTFTGTNSFSLRLQLDSLTNAFVAEHTDMALERLDGEEDSYERMREAVESMPFLTSQKLVILHDPSRQKKFTEEIDAFLQSVAETTEVIIVEAKLDKRLSYYKTLKKKTEFKEFNELDANGLARWASEYAKQGGCHLTIADANFLVDRVGISQQNIAQEVDKLSLTGATISRQVIENLTEPTPQSTIFELIEAAFSGNSKRMIALYAEQRAMKVEPQQIIAMLTWQLHVLTLVKTAGSRSPEAVAKEAKLNPFVVKKSAAVARKLSIVELKRMVQDLLIIDMRLKREAIDADEVLQHYLLQMAFGV